MQAAFEKIIEKLEEIREKKTCNKEKCDTKELCRTSDNGAFPYCRLRSLRNPCSILHASLLPA